MTAGRAYAFKPRVSFPIDAQTAGEELDKIRGHNSGEVTPEAVVEAAKDSKNPLHAVFEWDDGKAGHQYRVQQAGTLIRSVIVTVTGGGDSQSQPMQVSVTAVQPSASSAKVVTAEELHKAKVDRGWREIEGWHKQYGELPEFVGIAAALGGFFALRSAADKKDVKAA